MAEPSATDLVNDFLSTYGLESLTDWAWGLVKQNKQWDEIHLLMQNTAEYKQRFPAMAELKKQPDRGPFNEGDYVNFEKDARSLSSQYGIPYEMYSTPQAIAKLVLNNVGVPEMNERFKRAAYAAMQAPEEVKRAYSDLYGLSGGDLIATFLDADKALPILQNKAAAAAIAGAAYQQGTRADLAEAERLASLGIDYAGAVQGYGQAQGLQGLDYAAGMQTTREDRVNAAFGDQAAQQRVRQAQEARQAAFQAGGGLAAGQQGVSGLGRNTA